MMVKCKLDNVTGGKLTGLTIGKSYVVTDIDNIGYRIIDNELRNFWYSKELFHPIEIERDKKIEQILNENNTNHN